MARKTTCDLCDKEIRGYIYKRFEVCVELQGSILDFYLETGGDEDSPDICSNCFDVIVGKVEAGIKEGLEEIEAHF